jgi:membrane associated rhomboid family serine protease
MLETVAHRSYVPLALLFGIVSGSALSVWLLPATSIGVSGGVLALLALQAVIEYRKRAVLPRALFRSTVGIFGAVALLGLAGYAFIDNAAHAGGTLAGLMMGGVLFGPRGFDPSSPPPRAIIVSGWIALAILGVAMLATIAEIIAYARGYVILGWYGL